MTAKTTDPTRVRADCIAGEVWAWLNRHDAPWSPSDATVNDLAFAIAETLDQPACEAVPVAPAVFDDEDADIVEDVEDADRAFDDWD